MFHVEKDSLIMAKTQIKTQVIGDRQLTDIKMGTTQCAFSVYDNVGGQQTRTGVVPFNTKVYDIGNNFSTSTYKFTAPVKGIYQFNYHQLTTDTSSRSGAYKNGTCIISCTNNGVPFSWCDLLNAGDTVWIQGQGGYDIRYYATDMHNNFSGCLIREIP